MKILFKLLVAGIFGTVAVILLCGGIVGLVDRVDVGEPARPTGPAAVDGPADAALTVTPPASEADATVVSRSEVAVDAAEALREKSPDRTAGIHPALLQAARLCIHRKQPPSMALNAGSRSLREGTVVYLGEPVQTISAVSDYVVQVSLQDGTTAFIWDPSLQGVVTGRSFVPGLVHITGTQPYTTVLGARQTGWAMRRVSNSEWLKADHAAAEADAEERSNAAREALQAELAELQETLDSAKPDTFTSADGNHTTEATVVGYADGKVKLVKLDGTEVSVPLDRLDKRSQDIARTRIATRSRANTRITYIHKELGGE